MRNYSIARGTKYERNQTSRPTNANLIQMQNHKGYASSMTFMINLLSMSSTNSSANPLSVYPLQNPLPIIITSMTIRGAGEQIKKTVSTGTGSKRIRIALAGRSSALGSVRSVTFMAIRWRIFPFQPRYAMRSSPRAKRVRITFCPSSGWVSFYIRAEGDVEKAIRLFERSYNIAQKQKANS